MASEFLTKTKSPVLIHRLSSLKEEKWTWSGGPLWLGGTGSLVHWKFGLYVTDCLKYLVLVILKFWNKILQAKLIIPPSKKISLNYRNCLLSAWKPAQIQHVSPPAAEIKTTSESIHNVIQSNIKYLDLEEIWQCFNTFIIVTVQL